MNFDKAKKEGKDQKLHNKDLNILSKDLNLLFDNNINILGSNRGNGIIKIDWFTSTSIS